MRNERETNPIHRALRRAQSQLKFPGELKLYDLCRIEEIASRYVTILKTTSHRLVTRFSQGRTYRADPRSSRIGCKGVGHSC